MKSHYLNSGSHSAMLTNTAARVADKRKVMFETREVDPAETVRTMVRELVEDGETYVNGRLS